MSIRVGTAWERVLLVVAGVVLAGAAARGVRAEVKLPAVFSDHMVLQREMAVPVWGQAAPDEQVTVRFRDQTRTATADKDGRWSVRLESLTAGGPDKLTVAGSHTVTLDDVLVGEVWVGSGQSNMAGGVGGYAKGDEGLAKLAARTYPQLRLCKGSGGGWRVADEAGIAGFSALLFAFGQPLHEALDVPVGLIVGAVGGTPSGRWLTPEMLAADAACQEALRKFSATYDYDRQLAQHERAMAEWKKAADAAEKEGKKPPRAPAKPGRPGDLRGGRVGDLYEQHIQPVVGFGIRGVLWDQGESGTALEGLGQFVTMGALIRGWRTAWNQGAFPFLYVQKPSGGGCAWDPADPVTCKAEPFAALPAKPPQGEEGRYREEHIRIRQHPQTAIVTSTDLGSGVHPVNKSGYGQRAARVALGFAYGRKVEICGPVYDSQVVEGKAVRVKFRHVGQGLAQRHGERLQGFQIAGDDRVFHWADATIDGDTVVVSSSQVAQPVAVRYAWSNQSPWANLFNQDGLPALTFCTDNW